MKISKDLKILLATIEDLRKELCYTVRQGKSISDPSVIKLSQDLDEELNKYYRIARGEAKTG
ncbi:aspartyl-phosphate phosphatase Spo0E family protein [Desulfosporosinus meridiei]|uniref:Spo0E like sporulation regulatory protein n=1 Tax=Desulfosporosinus meridiei (strain ATCC BAA-275 / DSM 13257 / KCTC 12902 / NCIMB 13706 / S10) TaxID=768704 RepID=J7IWE1_DESMD|nr:aspartyl-phosphate phosphatase Spo0E family protein [Desulfosporosinus meridiei]AFQ43423.1 Spo0E like sporulation regulatory protein [Desulfosporosinus meridiei DSM 13257]